MKTKLLTGFIIAIAVNFATAFPNHLGNYTSNLTLSASHGGRYIFEMNGIAQNTNGNTLYLQQVQQGVHQLRILKWRNAFMSQGYWDMVYQGTIQIPANSNVMARWDQWSGLQVQSTPIYNGGYPHTPVVCPPVYPPVHPPVNNPGYYPPNNGFNNGNGFGMHPSVFQQFISQMRQASFDSNKVSLAKNGIRNNGISVNQLQQVLREFSFDSNRLEVAQFAYNYTVDRNNYFLLHSSFDFQSNANHLMNSIH